MSRLDDVNAFITQSRNCRTADDLRRLMEAITCEMGFHFYALYQHVKHFSWPKDHALAISNYPRGWLELFFEQNMVADDPVHHASYRTSVGFRFADIPSLIPFTERGRGILEAARQAGLRDGFCVPAQVPGEGHGTCTFATRNGAALPELNLPMAQLIGSFAYEAARRIQLSRPAYRPGIHGLGADQRPSITSRQIECLVLVAKGKSDWEIAHILGIGPETVKHHIRIVRERYEVGTRIQAAIRAISEGHVSISEVTS